MIQQVNKKTESAKKTRFKVAIALCGFLMLVTIIALYKGANEVATQSITALMIIGPTYIAGDSYRKSSEDEKQA